LRKAGLDSRSPGGDLNLGHAEYEAGEVTVGSDVPYNLLCFERGKKKKNAEGKENRERKKEVKETKGVNQEPRSVLTLPGSSEHSREDW
jgi:hypothetical protein